MRDERLGEVVRVALEAGPWPVRELMPLLKLATAATERSISEAANEIGVQRKRVVFWIPPDMSVEDVSYFLEGFSREQLIRHLASRQEPRATSSERSLESSLDDWHDLMGAKSVYEDPNAYR